MILGLQPPSLVWALTVGTSLGIICALSPLTAWFAIVMTCIFLWAGHGLNLRERRWIWGVLGIAVGLRLVTIAVLFVGSDHHQGLSFFWDGDGAYMKQRALWIRNVWADVPVAPPDAFDAFDRSYGWTAYLYVLAYVQYLAGPAPYGVYLHNVALFVAAAVMLYRIARTAYGPLPALLGFVLLLFLPTLFAWSVSALKESLYLFLGVLGMVAAVTLVRTRTWGRRVLAIAALVGAAAAVSTVRVGGSLILTLGLGAGLAGSVIVRRASLVILILVGLPFAAQQIRSPGDIQARIMSQLRTSAGLHMGNVQTEGHAYRLLDQRFYSARGDQDPIATMTPVEALRFVLRALASFVVVPLPWQIQSKAEMVFLPQQLVWYGLVVLAPIGLLAGLRRDAVVTCLFAGLVTAGAIVVALNSGNIGSLVRHRDTVVPFVVWLSALGAVAAVTGLMPRERTNTLGQPRRIQETCSLSTPSRGTR